MSSCAVNVPGLTCAQSRAVLVGLGLGLALVVLLPLLAKNARGIGSAAGGAAVDFADGLFSESVLSAGDLVGVPRTESSQCQADLAAGRYWDASFSCSAGDYLRGIFK